MSVVSFCNTIDLSSSQVTFIPPVVALKLIASSTVSVDVILTDEPVATISISSPAEAPDAKILIPPL